MCSRRPNHLLHLFAAVRSLCMLSPTVRSVRFEGGSGDEILVAAAVALGRPVARAQLLNLSAAERSPGSAAVRRALRGERILCAYLRSAYALDAWLRAAKGGRKIGNACSWCGENTTNKCEGMRGDGCPQGAGPIGRALCGDCEIDHRACRLCITGVSAAHSTDVTAVRQAMRLVLDARALGTAESSSKRPRHGR